MTAGGKKLIVPFASNPLVGAVGPGEGQKQGGNNTKGQLLIHLGWMKQKPSS